MAFIGDWRIAEQPTSQGAVYALLKNQREKNIFSSGGLHFNENIQIINQFGDSQGGRCKREYGFYIVRYIKGNKVINDEDVKTLNDAKKVATQIMKKYPHGVK
tara:strand:- start:315 stop:623 length:309 start_codon:yes stop_codon:yes gene_type:complete